MLKACVPYPHLHHHNSIFSTPIFPSYPPSLPTRVPLGRPYAQRLQLYESHAVPRYYACFEKHSAPGKTSESHILAPVGSSFNVAFDHFKNFFKLKTGIEWDQRCRSWMVPDANFIFMPPRIGEPRGILQEDYAAESA